jgi:hypothetical protein
LGASTALLVANVFLQAVTGRTSAYLARDDGESASRILLLGGTGAVVTTVFIAVASLAVAAGAEAVGAGVALTFAATALLVTPVWYVSAALSIVQGLRWVAIALAVDIAVLVAVDRALRGTVEHHLLFGGISGAAFAMTILVVVLHHRLGTTRRDRGPVHLPTPAYLVHEALPYGTHGGLLVGLVITPYVLAWFATAEFGADRYDAFMVLQLALTAAVMPTLFAANMLEKSVWRLWSHARMQQSFAGRDATDGFARDIERFVRGERLNYLVGLASATIGVGVVVAVIVGFGVFDVTDGPIEPSAGVLFFGFALVGYGCFGLAQFNVMLLMTLAHPARAVRAESMAFLVIVLLGAPLAAIHYQFVGVAFAASGAVLALTSDRAAHGLLRDAHHAFTSAV